MNQEQLSAKAKRMLSRAQKLGLSKDGKALAIDQMYELIAAGEGCRNQHVLRSNLSDDEGSLLHEGGEDYVLKDGYGVWLTVDSLSIRVHRTDEGVVVDMYGKGAEDSGSIGSTYAFYNDSEDALCERYGIEDIDQVAEWVGLHYGCNFDKEPPAKRADWIQRYSEAHEPECGSDACRDEEFIRKQEAVKAKGVKVRQDRGQYLWLCPEKCWFGYFDTEEEAWKEAFTWYSL